MRMIVAGNWKMNKDRDEATALIAALKELTLPQGVEVIVAPAFPFLAIAVDQLAGSSILVAAQDCHEKSHGAYTGAVSVPMLRSIGVKACIVGHSERRQYFGETDKVVGLKIGALLEHGLIPIYCCGESQEERVSGKHFEVVTNQVKVALGALSSEQLSRVVIAYEPVWAIGTGLTATSAQAQEMHAHIRGLLSAHGADLASRVPILYGGSCKPDNAAELFANRDVNGGLIGGASLDAAQFGELIRLAGRA
ncbi:MAG TPA: triose-phosphate isomerase [Flavobacteriales bacterium]|nr:triose-phosphate isomerase [Flavobacteriales bacterium]